MAIRIQVLCPSVWAWQCSCDNTFSYPCTLTPFATRSHTQSLEDQLKHRDHEWVELEAKLLETQTKYSREKEAQKRYSR